VGQSTVASLIEGLTNETCSFGLGVLIQLYALPLMGIHVNLGQSLVVASIFTTVGLVRMFCIRRAFNHLTRHFTS
jgi:hypothetical protein